MISSYRRLKKKLGCFGWNEGILSPFLFGIGIAATFLGQLLLSHTISAEEFGIFVTVYSAATVFSAIGSSGFDLAATRFVSIAKSKHDYETLRHFASFMARITVLMSVVGSVLFAAFISISIPLTICNIIASTIIVYLWSCARSLAGAMRGMGALPLAIMIDRVSRDLAVFLFAIIAYFLVFNVSIFASLIALLLGTFIGVLVGLYWTCVKLRSFPATKAFRKPNIEAERSWLRASRGLMGYNLIELFSSRFDIFVLAFLISSQQVGAFGIAVILLNIVGIPAIFLGITLLPKVALLAEAGDPVQLRRHFKFSSVLTVVSGCLIAFLLFTTQSFVLRLLAPSMIGVLNWDIVFIAAFVRSISLIGTFPVALLSMTGRHNELMVGHVASILLRSGVYVMLLHQPSAELGILALVGGSLLTAIINLFQVRRCLFSPACAR